MVTITFKLEEVDTLQCPVEKESVLDEVVQRCAKQGKVNLGGYLAVRNGQVIRPADAIYPGDHIDIYPALSGG